MLRIIFSPCNSMVFSIIIPNNVSVSGWYIQMFQIIFFPCNAMVSSNIIPMNVSISSWYIQMFQIVFSHARQWYLLILS